MIAGSRTKDRIEISFRMCVGEMRNEMFFDESVPVKRKRGKFYSINGGCRRPFNVTSFVAFELSGTKKIDKDNIQFE